MNADPTRMQRELQMITIPKHKIITTTIFVTISETNEIIINVKITTTAAEIAIPSLVPTMMTKNQSHSNQYIPHILLVHAMNTQRYYVSALLVLITDQILESKMIAHPSPTKTPVSTARNEPCF